MILKGNVRIDLQDKIFKNTKLNKIMVLMATVLIMSVINVSCDMGIKEGSEKENSGQENSEQEIFYILSFETNEGSAVNSLSVKNGEAASAPTPPTRDGYRFIGRANAL